jgi:hypothetical protein
MKQLSVRNKIFFLAIVIAICIVLPMSIVFAASDRDSLSSNVVIYPNGLEFVSAPIEHPYNAPLAITIDDGCPGADPPGFERRAPPAQDAWICISAQNTVHWAYGGDALYVRTNASPVEWVKWRPTIGTSGSYKVEVSIPNYDSNADKTQQARYMVHHANGDTWRTVNQKANAGSWYNLGTFTFNSGANGYVYLESYTPEDPLRLLAADAVRFTRIDGPTPTPSPTPIPGKTLDVRYVDQVYVQQVPECFSNGLCYWNHCGPSSVAMALHYEGKESRDVLYNRQATLDLVCAVKREPGCRGGSKVGKMVNTLHNRGLQAHTDWSPTFAEIKQNIRNGHPVLLFVWGGRHVAVATGYEDNGALLINDPYGGVSWWTTGTTKNIPPGSSPKLNGYNITYSSISGLSLTGGIFITGQRPTRQAASTTITETGGTLTSEGIQIDFPPLQSNLLLANQVLTVTYTPQLSTTHPISGFEATMVTFEISATDVNNQPVQYLNETYTITANIDLAVIDDWDTVLGFTTEDGDPNPINIANTSEITAVMAGWDNDLQKWIVVPGVIDVQAETMTAHATSFTEYAVLIERKFSVYLPVVLR